MWQVALGSATMAAIPVPGAPACNRIDDVGPTMLADGRIAFQRRCTPGARGPNTFDTTLTALNNDGSLTVLANLGGLPFVPRQVAWSASATEGILWGGSRICDGLLAVDRSGVKALDVEINASGHAFNLKDFVSNNCTDTGNAELPAWSKDGHTIAFLASGDAVGKSDAARLDASYSLFTMDSQAWIPRQLLSNIVQPMGLAWSPDGTKVAFSATVGGNPGTWILNAGSGRLTRVAQTNHLDVAWSPDGSQLAALENETQAPADPNIHIVFDVGSIK